MNFKKYLDEKGGIGGVIIGFAVVIVLIVAILGGLFGYVWNATPEKLKIADVKLFDDVSLREMGFAEMKIKDIYKQLKDLTDTDNDKVVQNSPTDEDKSKAEGNVGNTSTEGIVSDDGNTDYTKLLTVSLTYDNQYLLSYEDTTIAYLMNQIVSQSVNQNNNEGVEFLKTLNATVAEISITREEGAENATMRMVISINTINIKERLIKELGGTLGKLLPVPDVLYAVAYFNLDENPENIKMIDAIGYELKINDTENAVSSALFKVIGSMAGGETDMSEEELKTFIYDKIAMVFETVLYNLGDLGTATTKIEDDIEVIDTNFPISYGETGICNGKITLITRVE